MGCRLWGHTESDTTEVIAAAAVIVNDGRKVETWIQVYVHPEGEIKENIIDLSLVLVRNMFTLMIIMAIAVKFLLYILLIWLRKSPLILR